MIEEVTVTKMYRYSGIPSALAAAVRATGKSPQYGHPTHTEVATGYGPCRECLDTFREGEEERILFTYQPFESGFLPAPGPVFIHREACRRYQGTTFPGGLLSVPMIVEGFGADGEPVTRMAVNGEAVEVVVDRVFVRPDVAFGHLRNAEVGCFIARVDRAQD